MIYSYMIYSRCGCWRCASRCTLSGLGLEATPRRPWATALSTDRERGLSFTKVAAVKIHSRSRRRRRRDERRNTFSDDYSRFLR